MMTVSHTMQYLFAGCAVALVLLVIAFFAWALLGRDKTGEREAARCQEAYDLVKHQREKALTALQAGTISQEAFAREEATLAKKLVSLVNLNPVQTGESKTFTLTTLIALLVVIPAGTAGLYLKYGDFSSLDERAIAQIEAVRTEDQREAQMRDTVASLEAQVQKNPDLLEAWEILADYYAINEQFDKAIEAGKAVMRLNPKNTKVASDLLEALVVTGQESDPMVQELIERVLKDNPFDQKTLLIAGLLRQKAKDYKMAVLYWNRLRTVMPEGSDERTMMDERIKDLMKEGKILILPPDPVLDQPTMGSMMDKMSGGGISGLPPIPAQANKP